jgi:hypothetical protein
MQVVKPVHIKAPQKELAKSAQMQIQNNKKGLPITINEVEEESSQSMVSGEKELGYSSMNNDRNSSHGGSSALGHHNGSTSAGGNRSTDENVSLTVNLIGDSIKDNFVLQRISDILPDFIIPEFDKERKKVKYVVPRSQIEKNPQIQTLFQKIQGVQAMERSNQSKNSKVSNSNSDNSRPNSSLNTKPRQYQTESPKELDAQKRQVGGLMMGGTKKKQAERNLFIEDALVNNNLNSSFPRGLLEDSPNNKSLNHRLVDSPPKDKEEFREELLKSDREKDNKYTIEKKVS